MDLLKAYRIENKLHAVRLIDSWEAVTGKLISNHTVNLYVKQKTLFVYLDSAALRNELSYAKKKIIKALNKEVGVEVITDIKFS
ncbi:MAG: DUF721 domain-containing protein [Bacteroidales bacterium]|nr:DUF721 domain-containing protein [Bacteroidales bacterium]